MIKVMKVNKRVWLQHGWQDQFGNPPIEWKASSDYVPCRLIDETTFRRMQAVVKAARDYAQGCDEEQIFDALKKLEKK